MSVLTDIINRNIFKKAREFIKKIKFKIFKPKDTLQIEIHSRNDHQGQAVPRIRIGNIHNGSIDVDAGNDVHGENIGHGITVKKQGKPKRCPYCASPARDENNNDNIVPNTSAGGKWYCKVCGSIL